MQSKDKARAAKIVLPANLSLAQHVLLPLPYIWLACDPSRVTCLLPTLPLLPRRGVVVAAPRRRSG